MLANTTSQLTWASRNVKYLALSPLKKTTRETLPQTFALAYLTGHDCSKTD